MADYVLYIIVKEKIHSSYLEQSRLLKYRNCRSSLLDLFVFSAYICANRKGFRNPFIHHYLIFQLIMKISETFIHVTELSIKNRCLILVYGFP